jgi:pentatricopeptide repeat protein
MVLSAYFELGEHELAKDMITTLEATNTKIDVSVYETFISTLGYGAGGDRTAEEVVQMVNHMQDRGLQPGVSTYLQLLNNFINSQQHDRAFNLLASLYSDGKVHTKTAELFAPLVRAFCSDDEAAKALKVVDLMKKVQVLPNEFVVTALIFCLVKGKLFKEAWDTTTWAKGSGLDTLNFEDVIRTAQKKSIEL